MYYKLVNRQVIPINGDPRNVVIEWAKQFENDDRFVAQTTVGDLMVSTVFLGLDHSSFTGAPPELFETMVFNKDGEAHDQKQWRCSTYEEAQAQHRAVVEKVSSANHDDLKHLQSST